MRLLRLPFGFWSSWAISRAGVYYRYMTRRNPIIGYVAIIASVFFVSSAGSVVTESGLDWYETLVRPALAPPGGVIGFAWSLIFLCVAVSAITLYTRAKYEERVKLMVLFGINGCLNILWTVLFFGFRQIDLALIEIVALQISTLWIMVMAFSISKRAVALLLPYALWVPFAGYLTWRILVLN